MARRRLPRVAEQHEIDVEAVNFLRSVAQTHFIVRDEHPDYGLDGELEFKDAGEATNRRIGFQLKGSRQPWKRARSQTLDESTHHYLQEAPFPVLVVLYSGERRKLYTRWIHEHDPYYQTGKKPRFTFRDADEWTESTPAALMETWEIYQAVKSGRIPRPILVSVTVGTKAKSPGRDAAIRRDIVDSLRGAGNLFAFARKGQQGYLRIFVGPEEISANLHVTGCTYHFDKHDLQSEMPPNVVANEVLAAVGVALANAGSVLESAEAFGVLPTLRPLSRLRLFAVACVAALEARDFSLFERLMRETLDDKGESRGDRLDVAWLAFRLAASKLPDEFADRVGLLFEERAHEDKSGNAFQRLAYLFRGRADDKALVCNIKAMRQDSGLAQDAAFLRGLAGALFETGMPYLSFVYYKRAIDYGCSDPAIYALAADAIMHCGDYRLALSYFDSYFDKAESPHPEWCIKAAVLRQMVIPAVGERCCWSKVAGRLADEALEQRSPQPDEAGTRRLLRADPHHPNGWVNLAFMGGEQTEVDGHEIEWRVHPEYSFLALLTGAALRRGDPKAWVLAVTSGLATTDVVLMPGAPPEDADLDEFEPSTTEGDGEPSLPIAAFLVPLAVEAAYQFCQNEFLADMEWFTHEVYEPDAAEEIVSLCEDVVAAMRTRAPQPVDATRLWLGGGQESFVDVEHGWAHEFLYQMAETIDPSKPKRRGTSKAGRSLPSAKRR